MGKQVSKMYGSCFRKKIYRTIEYAQKEAKRLSRVNGIELYIYWCPLCLNYHLTKQKQKY